jgi:hypothetical protein
MRVFLSLAVEFVFERLIRFNGTGRSTLGGWEVVLVHYTVGLQIVFQDFGNGSFVPP